MTRVSLQDGKKERKRFDLFIIINVNGDNLTRKGIMTMSHFRETSSVPFLSPLRLTVHCVLYYRARSYNMFFATCFRNVVIFETAEYRNCKILSLLSRNLCCYKIHICRRCTYNAMSIILGIVVHAP